LKQFAIASVRKTWQDMIDPCQRAVDAIESPGGLAHDIIDRLTAARQRCGIALERQHRIFQDGLVADKQPVDIVQRIADRLDLAQVGGQGWNAVRIQRYRRRGRRATRQRYGRYTGEALGFQSHNRVLADRSAVIDPGKDYNLAGALQLERQYLADLNSVEIDVAALVQATGGALENNTQRSALLD